MQINQSINKSYTAETKILDVIADPVFENYGRLIFPVDSSYYSGDTLSDLRLTWYSNIDLEKTVEIANYMKNHVAAGAYANPKPQSKDDITSAELQDNNSNQNVITVPVDIKTVKNSAFIWLGEFTLSYGDIMYYDVSAEKGNGLKTGFAALNDDPLNRTYFSISNKREDGTLETKGDFTFEAPVKPGQYNYLLRLLTEI